MTATMHQGANVTEADTGTHAPRMLAAGNIRRRLMTMAAERTPGQVTIGSRVLPKRKAA